MKGLLLKDLYMLRAYCKSYVLVVVVFLGASFIGENTFFIYYPCLLCGMIPVNLLAYDEKSRFLQYSAALPVSKRTFVSEKYLMGLFSQAAVLLLTGLVRSIGGAPEGFLVMMLSLLLVSMLASSIPLPLIFRNGVEKGRIAYYVMIGIVCGAGILFSEMFKVKSTHLSGIVFALLAGLGICLYGFSWYLSVKFYERREL